MSSTIDPRNQNALDNIRNILRNSTEKKTGFSQTMMNTEHHSAIIGDNNEELSYTQYKIDYAAKRLSRSKILHNRNQSMGAVIDFKKQLHQVQLKKVTIRKEERDQL